MDPGALASWIGAAISATATGITLWMRRRDRPEADFFLEPAQVIMGPRLVRQAFDAPRVHDEAISVVNVGDGDAYRVIVTSVGCRIRPFVKDADDKRGLRTFVVVPRLAPGDSFMLLAWNDEGTTAAQRIFKVTWLNSPTRHRRSVTKEIRRDEFIEAYPGEAQRYPDEP
jgi:hypothetical protein